MTFETLRYEIEADILTLTLNRPDQLNAFNGPMMNELLTSLPPYRPGLSSTPYTSALIVTRVPGVQ